MKSTKLKFLLIGFILVTQTDQLVMAQTKGIVVDKESRQPIPYVSIYTKVGDKVYGAMSNEQGGFSIDFTFQTLYLSHINYLKAEISKSNLSDTIYLEPTTALLREVVISNKQPKWINPVLMKVIERKAKNYQLTEKMLSYTYETYTLNDSNGYAFKSNGNLVIPQLKKNSQYKIDARNNTIKYKDKTAGPDFSNLKRMLYDDFVTTLDSKFIKENDFTLDGSFADKNRNIVQLNFTSKKYKDFDGYLVVDTLNSVILEVERSSGTDYNIKNQTSSFLRNLISSRAGFTYNTWITKSNSKYTKTGQSYYLSECSYKFYMKTTTRNKKNDSKYFTSIESKLDLGNEMRTKNTELKVIPKPYYLVLIMTKQMKQEEESSNKVPVNFEKF
jgi:hypothetical protein